MLHLFGSSASPAYLIAPGPATLRRRLAATLPLSKVPIAVVLASQWSTKEPVHPGVIQSNESGVSTQVIILQ
jgi:hypothetical protein